MSVDPRRSERERSLSNEESGERSGETLKRESFAFRSAPRHALCLDAYVTTDRTLDIPASDWASIKARWDRGEVTRELVRVIRGHKLPFPGSVRTEGVRSAYADFAALRSYNARRLLVRKQAHTRHEYAYRISDVVIESSPVGLLASDYFHRHNRLLCSHLKFPSPIRTWNSNRRLASVLGTLWSLKQPRVTRAILEAAVSLRSYIAAQFRPSAAKLIYELFNAKHVLDPCAGWGDRFAGFSAAKGTRSYVGVDPNSRLWASYWAQGLAYRTHKAYHFEMAPFEDSVLLGRHTYDFVFTSPPYFGTERYSNDPGQSWIRYDTMRSWLHDFLLVLVRKAWERLDDGGVMALNIADLGVSFAETSVCDTMNDCIGKLPGANYAGALGMKLASRPKTGLSPDSAFIEPVWVWTKGTSRTVEDYVGDYTGGGFLHVE